MNEFVINTFSFGLVVPKYPEIPTNVNSSDMTTKGKACPLLVTKNSNHTNHASCD